MIDCTYVLILKNGTIYKYNIMALISEPAGKCEENIGIPRYRVFTTVDWGDYGKMPI
jgi:hypothetical protein